MCDTVVALGNVTKDGVTLFGKNSDREPNEAHHLLLVPAADHPQGSQVQCTYIQIPQVTHTYRVLLAKPFWIWGAEMGANEHQVAIGNEAVFTRVPHEKGPGLTGMDLLRLALERSRTAEEARQVIIDLIDEFSQGGNCGFSRPFYYHNSFLIADPHEAWILETAGRHWASRRVKDIGTISNAITIHDRWDDASADLINYAIDRKWCRQQGDFDFARCYSDPLYTRFAAAGSRRNCTRDSLNARRGEITERTLMAAMRQHRSASSGVYRPDIALAGADVCMHAGFGPVRINQTTGTMVSRLEERQGKHWLTGTSAPCTGLFKPVWDDAGLPETGPQPAGKYDAASLWWRHERLHRAVLRAYPQRVKIFQEERDQLEEKWLDCAAGMEFASVAERYAFSASCFHTGDDRLEHWLERVKGSPNGSPRIYSRHAWAKFDRLAQMEEG